MGNSVKFALLTFFLFSFLLANAQTVTREYDVISNKEKVGSVVAVNRELNGFEHYLITCEMSVRMILKINVSYNLKASFKNGFLMSSAATMYLNGKIQSQVQVERSGTNYVMIKDGVTEIITEPIEYSSARLYFHLPDGDKKVFSETDGTFKTLKRLSTYAFELTDPGNSGDNNKYTYVPHLGLLSILVDRQFIPTFQLTYAGETVLDN